MKRIFNIKTVKRFICLVLVAALTITGMPVESLAAQGGAEASESDGFKVSSQILSLQNDYTAVHMSGTNGGFYISNVEGDKTVKSDNNKELLYHSDDFDTSFTTFRITKNGNASDYIFGGDYSYEGIETSPVTVLKDETGLSAKWTLGELEFTERLELANSGSNEHGMVCISYDVQNNGTDDVAIEARLLLDSAIGNQDYVYYELPDTSYESDIIRKECVIDAGEVPTTFFAYDDLKNPSATANCVISSKGMLKRIAFAHWNSLAATDFDFAPDESFNFTNEGNDEYGTADSAMAMYYDLGTITAGKQGLVNTYYGVYSNEKIKPDVDSVAFNMSAPATLELSADNNNYVSNCNRDGDGNFKEDGIFNIQASLKNVSNDTDYDEVAVAVYASEGITPLDEHQQELSYETSYSRPFTSSYVDFKRGTDINIPFYFRADVDDSASYRKITFRVYKITSKTDSNLLFENMLYEGSTYVLCPGGNGKLPEITFNSATPNILYNEFSRHVYITGRNFTMLEDKSRYTLYAEGEDIIYKIPSSNITVYAGENKLDILFNETMKPGNYKLVFDWIEPPAGVDKKLTGDALTIVMSDDIKYRNDYYGLLAVVQEEGTAGSDAKYDIKTFSDEEEYEKSKGGYEEVLLLFKGDFIKDETFDKGKNGDNARYVAKSVDGDKDKIIINGCIDAFNGTVVLTKKDGKINTDFDDITLNASVENTRIYKGNAGLTSIEDGQEFGLVPYNTDGEELGGFEDEVITLIYPSALNGLMTIAGMAFDLSFARLGMMYDTDAKKADKVSSDDAKGFIMSFSASLDLSFLIPVSKRDSVDNSTGTGSGSNVFSDAASKADDLRDQWKKTYRGRSGSSGSLNKNKKNNKDDDKEDNTKGTVQVKNVLYGMNQGFIGVNFEAEIGVPGYTDSMPEIEGKLEVNTVNDWSFSVEGKAAFLKSITLEVNLGFKSKNNIPIVDNMYFFVQGVKPGINVDSLGICWILGGGGGFENLYDTIFCASEVPPIRLLLSVSFGVFQVLEARADLSLGLTGFDIKVSDLKVANTDIEIMEYARMRVDWLPYFRLLMQCSIDCLGVIQGKGYIVIDGSDGAEEAFEAYAQAAIQIPDAIPLIGGIEVGSAALGLNTTRIWGALKVLGFSTGVSYVYGGDLSFGVEANVEPTYPQYLEEDGVEDVNGQTWYAVGYDAEKKDTLYMSLGANVHQSALANGEEGQENAGSELTTGLYSDITKMYHNVTLGKYENGGAQVLSVAFSADTLEQAQAIKEGFIIRDESNTRVYLKYYDNEKSDEENADANANFSYNKDKKEGTIVVSFTDSNQYNRKYSVRTAVSSELILYAVDPLPEVTDISVSGTEYSDTDNKVTVSWNGNAKMSELEKMDIYVTDSTDVESEGGTPVASLNKGDISKKTIDIQLPDTLQTGKYYIRAVYSKENVTTGIVSTAGTFGYTNSTQPQKVSSVSVTNAGDMQLKAQIDAAADDKCEGALFTLYEAGENGEKTALPDYSVSATKNESKEIFAVLGGSSDNSTTDETGETVVKKEGLKANGRYVVSVKPFNKITDSEGNLTGLTYGEETFSDEIILNEPKKAAITLTADKRKYQVGRTEYVKDDNGNAVEETVMYDTYNSSDISFTAATDMKVSGTWVLDGEEVKTGTFTDTEQIPIALSGIADGDHTITIYGNNENGDGFSETFVFNVDTVAPTLLLKSPTYGSVFNEDGTLTVSGITEDDAYITVNVDGKPVLRSKTLKDINAVIGEEGDFSFDINIGKGYYRKNVEVIVSDEVGNIQRAQCDVYNNGLGNVKGLDVTVSADTTDNTEKEWISYSNKNLFLNENGDTSVALQLCAVTNENNTIVLNDMENVEWNINTVLGSAEVTDNKLTITNGSHGFGEGKLLLSDGAAMSASFTFGAEAQGQTEEKGYKVTYDANGGEGAMTDPNSPYSKNDSVLVAECGFTKQGTTFVEWNTEADGSGTTYIPGDRFYIKDNITLYAIWDNPPVATDTPAPSGTPKVTATPAPSGTPKVTATPAPSGTPKVTATPTPTGTPKVTATPTPAGTPKAAETPAPAAGDRGNGEGSSPAVGSIHTAGKVRYMVTSADTVTYTGTTDKKAKKLVVPDKVTINGRTYSVTAVGSDACKGCKKLTGVVIGKNVTAIASKAFYNKKKLKSIKFKGAKISRIGSAAFKGINKKAVFKVPKKAVKKYKKKLNKKTGFIKKSMMIK